MKKIITCLLMFVCIFALASGVRKATEPEFSNAQSVSGILNGKAPENNVTNEKVSSGNEVKSDIATVNSVGKENDKYIGEWVGENSILEIKKDGDNYDCYIKYIKGPNEFTEWSYLLASGETEGEFVCLKDGKCESVITSDTQEETRTTKYNDGSCTIFVFENKILWVDEKERFGDDITFEKKI